MYRPHWPTLLRLKWKETNTRTSLQSFSCKNSVNELKNCANFAAFRVRLQALSFQTNASPAVNRMSSHGDRPDILTTFRRFVLVIIILQLSPMHTSIYTIRIYTHQAYLYWHVLSYRCTTDDCSATCYTSIYLVIIIIVIVDVVVIESRLRTLLLLQSRKSDYAHFLYRRRGKSRSLARARRRRLLPSSQTWLPWCQKLMTFRPARPGARPLPWWRHHSSWTCVRYRYYFSSPENEIWRDRPASPINKYMRGEDGRPCLQRHDALTLGCWRDLTMNAVDRATSELRREVRLLQTASPIKWSLR